MSTYAATDVSKYACSNEPMGCTVLHLDAEFATLNTVSADLGQNPHTDAALPPLKVACNLLLDLQAASISCSAPVLHLPLHCPARQQPTLNDQS